MMISCWDCSLPCHDSGRPETKGGWVEYYIGIRFKLYVVSPCVHSTSMGVILNKKCPKNEVIKS